MLQPNHGFLYVWPQELIFSESWIYSISSQEAATDNFIRHDTVFFFFSPECEWNHSGQKT